MKEKNEKRNNIKIMISILGNGRLLNFIGKPNVQNSSVGNRESHFEISFFFFFFFFFLITHVFTIIVTV